MLEGCCMKTHSIKEAYFITSVAYLLFINQYMIDHGTAFSARKNLF